MTTYNVPLVGTASLTVSVETDETDLAKIVDLAQEKINVGLCHKCSDDGNDNLLLGEEWAPNLDNGKPEVYKTS